MNGLAVYAIASMFTTSSNVSQLNNSPVAQNRAAVAPKAGQAPKFPATDPDGQRRTRHKALFRKGEALELWMFLCTSDDFAPEAFLGDVSDDFQNDTLLVRPADAPLLAWHQKNLVFGTKNARLELQKSISLLITEEFLEANATLYAQVWASRKGHEPRNIGVDSPDDPRKGLDAHVVHYSFPLTFHWPPEKRRTARSLLDGEDSVDDTVEAVVQEATATEEEDEDDAKWIMLLHPTFHLSFIELYEPFPINNVPAPLPKYMKFHEATANYYPVLYHNQFWTLSDRFHRVNSTLFDGDSVTPLTLNISLSSMGMWQFMMQVQMQNMWEQQSSFGMSSAKEQDTLKQVLLDTNPYLLGLTVLVSLLHMLFEILAFKNDVSFWRKNKSAEGLSLQSYGMNLAARVITFLYLLDNDTSWMVLLEYMVSIGIEVWKMQRLLKLHLKWEGMIPKLSLDVTESYAKGGTRKYDQIAAEHLLYAVSPCIVGFSAYSLVYNKHKGWYSWIISSLVGFVYAFGFVMMTPQLFINYKLKSVAHMPWRSMVYKALNTFIDDLFAFVVDMPLLHRLSCFRDDLIFFIFLYQRYLYPVDPTRVNEFGQVADPGEAEAKNGESETDGAERPPGPTESLGSID